ncbi:toxin-like protein 14 [Uloborus diversus]|uniref:toxin-like protein 14 n=1 Tax=Uloborus diversus TaxID=327109 RepID=UPI002408FF10|nr:toxin-like protein 14 [Uloborus diversus]
MDMFYTETLDTSSGFCVGDYGRIPVGKFILRSEPCEKITCNHGSRQGEGCGKVMVSKGSGCKLIKKEGNYPNCCPDVKCETNI